MSGHPLIPLTPSPIGLSSRKFSAISSWPFEDAFVGRLLREDIPQRVTFNNCRIWVYTDPDRELVGFGTIEVCRDYQHLTENRPHAFIPLLAVNPGKQRRGHGKAILNHLIGEAALLACQPGCPCHDVLLLEVYTSNEAATSLYKSFGFANIVTEPIFDPIEKETFMVMAKRVSLGAI